MKNYWRDVDTENNNPITDPKRLDAQYALDGGFHQVMAVETGSGTVTGSDVRTQIEFNDYGNVGITFVVQQGPEENPGELIPGATVTVKKDGVPIGTGTTDENGQVTIGVPGDNDYTFDVEAPGYKDMTDEPLEAGTEDMNKPVYMESDLSHPVVLETQTATRIDLLGAARAQNMKNYYFSLAPKAGYMWKDGTRPDPSELTVKIGATADNISGGTAITVTWDAAKNQYMLDGTQIVGTADLAIVIAATALEDVVVPTDDANAYKVTVNSGTGGKFDYTPNASATNASTFTPSGSTTDLTNVVETLGSGESTSATYKFKPDGPVDSGADTTKPYRAYVIDKFLVNGAEVALTDAQKIHGLDYQLNDITADQSITVTYQKATVDPKDPDTPDDDVILKEPEPEPASNAVISVVVGDYGKADVSGDGITAGTVDGYGRADYVVNENGSITLVIKPDSAVSQPDGTTQDYMIDAVMIDGKKVSAADLSDIEGVTGTWTAPTGEYATGDATL
ncbi:MAG: carboxypeptidase-like regulatory domain-containing protein, partial [Lachnospiraceae bacterium]|nr:carboxypeptidase-like regulatory domain-containing protein [Lachnospiraceae bacterium]